MRKWRKGIVTFLLLGFFVFGMNANVAHASDGDITYGADIGWLNQFES